LSEGGFDRGFCPGVSYYIRYKLTVETNQVTVTVDKCYSIPNITYSCVLYCNLGPFGVFASNLTCLSPFNNW